MGQDAMGCCDRGAKLDQQLIVAMKVCTKLARK